VFEREMSRSLKEGEVEELKSKADIYSVVSNYVKLKKNWQELYRTLSFP